MSSQLERQILPVVGCAPSRFPLLSINGFLPQAGYYSKAIGRMSLNLWRLEAFLSFHVDTSFRYLSMQQVEPWEVWDYYQRTRLMA